MNKEEEKKYIDERIEEYYKEQAKMPLGFLISKKANAKNVQKITDDARKNYRYKKLMKYEVELREERRRIDNLVNEMNSKFEDYMYKLSSLISRNIKPFKLEVKEYDNYDFTSPVNLERVTIQCEPFKMSFIQEKLPSDLVEKVKE